MAVSQFKVYSSSDFGAPQLSGTSGSLVTVLDAVLVNGYGNKTSAGWTKPLPNDAVTGSIGCWQYPSGSRLILFINDAAPTNSSNGNGGLREAWMTGWEQIIGLTGSLWGTGIGNFPIPSQTPAGSGSVPVRKSSSQDSTSRNWLMFVDAYTLYFFIGANDGWNWTSYVFGDIFSLNLTPDYYKGMILGRNNMAPSIQNRAEFQDCTFFPNSNDTNSNWSCFVTRTGGGNGSSILVNRVADSGKGNTTNITNNGGGSVVGTGLSGLLPTPNSSDNAYYLSPIWIAEQKNSALRGRMRGMWHVCHAVTNFTDGQVFSGGNELAGKTFQIVLGTTHNAMWAMEISNTLETNDLP